MDLQTALLAAVGGLVSTVVALAGVVGFLYRRDLRRQQSSESKIESIRKEMSARLQESEEHCRSELATARTDISRLQEDVVRLVARDRDMAVQAILFYAEKREYDRELIEAIASQLKVEIPPPPFEHRTTVQIKALTGKKA